MNLSVGPVNPNEPCVEKALAELAKKSTNADIGCTFWQGQAIKLSDPRNYPDHELTEARAKELAAEAVRDWHKRHQRKKK